MIRPEIIRRRLEKLDEYLAILRQLQRYSYDEFAANPERYGSAERFLHLAIESLNDLGNHVIAESGLGRVELYRPAFSSTPPHLITRRASRNSLVCPVG